MTKEEKLAEKRVGYNRTYYEANKDKWKTWASQKTGPQMQHQRQRKYGVSPDQFDAMLAAQNSECAICHTTEPKGHGTFHVDHCHTTKVVRGLLCHSCNVGLGHFRDDTALLLRASEYLDAARTTH